MRVGLIFLLSLLRMANAYGHVRSVSPKQDQIVEVRTALGIATMIQTQSAPSPAISGDLSGFRIEYLDRSTIVKPLRPGARTNLFLMTPEGRYNLRLLTGPESSADYVLYVNPAQPPRSFRWSKYLRYVRNSTSELVTSRIGKSSDGSIVLEVTIRSKQPTSLRPDDFWLLQAGHARVIDELYLSDLNVNKSSPASVYISFAQTDLLATAPVSIELRMSDRKPLVLQLDGLWQI